VLCRAEWNAGCQTEHQVLSGRVSDRISGTLSGGLSDSVSGRLSGKNVLQIIIADGKAERHAESKSECHEESRTDFQGECVIVGKAE
jgi:hypothetical protein